jgi:hypothetical protein
MNNQDYIYDLYLIAETFILCLICVAFILFVGHYVFNWFLFALLGLYLHVCYNIRLFYIFIMGVNY